jgi:hypothetical protein
LTTSLRTISEPELLENSRPATLARPDNATTAAEWPQGFVHSAVVGFWPVGEESFQPWQVRLLGYYGQSPHAKNASVPVEDATI